MELVEAKITAVIKRSIFINGHKTSVSLEDEFWRGLHEIARLNNVPVTRLVEQIDQERNNINLSSAIRVFVFKNMTK
jgi:predicted DNA-binding ribbon-helix-helix protein